MQKESIEIKEQIQIIYDVLDNEELELIIGALSAIEETANKLDERIKTPEEELLIELAKNELKYNKWLKAEELADYVLQRKTIIQQLKSLTNKEVGNDQ